MQYLILLFFMPALYIGFLSIRWLYQKVQKKDRIHRTKKALPLLLILLFLPIIPDRIAFGALNAAEKQPFWLYALIFYLFLDLIVFASYAIIRATNSHKNITKCLIVVIYSFVVISAAWWSYNALSLGLYEGRFGLSKNQAVEAVEKYLGSSINHSYIKAGKSSESWLVSESLKTRDSSAKTEIVYHVNRATGAVSRSPELKMVRLDIVKSNGQPADGVEAIVLYDKSLGQSQQGEWQNNEYAVSNSLGKADLWLENTSNKRYHMQIRDCAAVCTNYYFKFNYPLQESYSISLNPMTSGVTEL